MHFAFYYLLAPWGFCLYSCGDLGKCLTEGSTEVQLGRDDLTTEQIMGFTQLFLRADFLESDSWISVTSKSLKFINSVEDNPMKLLRDSCELLIRTKKPFKISQLIDECGYVTWAA